MRRMGKRPDDEEGGINVATAGVATQSRSFGIIAAYNAIDGNRDPGLYKGPCARVSRNNSWWRVDLLKTHKVFTVIVSHKERINGTEIRIGDSLENNGNNNATSALVTDPYAGFGDARNAIDGNRDSNYRHGSCSHTNMQPNPWWRLDLLDTYVITSIVITNRGDCCAARLNGAQIRIGNSLANYGNNNPRCAVISSIPAGATYQFRCNAMDGRYVNVVIPGRVEYLTLCEVEVYGSPLE
ncbi:fucolectin [Aplochiton taeniatus]